MYVNIIERNVKIKKLNRTRKKSLGNYVTLCNEILQRIVKYELPLQTQLKLLYALILELFPSICFFFVIRWLDCFLPTYVLLLANEIMIYLTLRLRKHLLCCNYFYISIFFFFFIYWSVLLHPTNSGMTHVSVSIVQ